MVRLVNTSLGSSSCIAHVLHSCLPRTRTSIGPAVIHNNLETKFSTLNPRQRGWQIPRLGPEPPSQSSLTQPHALMNYICIYNTFKTQITYHYNTKACKRRSVAVPGKPRACACSLSLGFPNSLSLSLSLSLCLSLSLFLRALTRSETLFLF